MSNQITFEAFFLVKPLFTVKATIRSFSSMCKKMSLQISNQMRRIGTERALVLVDKLRIGKEGRIGNTCKSKNHY